MKRLFLIAWLALLGAPALEAQLSPPETEEASEFARRAAKAAVAGPQRVFLEALDADGILQRGIGSSNWNGLTERQREQLRSVVRDHFVQTLAPPRASSPGEIAWSSAPASSSVADGADILLGLKYGDQTLKTSWLVRRAGGGWQVADVVLSDPGISLAEASLRALGPEPVRHRDRRREAERAAYPRIAALAAIALLLVLVAPRLSRGKRVLLYLTASAPVILFVVDGVLAVRRTLAEAYALAPVRGRPAWREAEQQALEADREGRVAEARQHWARAIAQGDPAAPVYYQMGLLAKGRGELKVARADFEHALAEKSPAPGAAKELAVLNAAEGKLPEAERMLERYLALTGPDPEILSLLAVIQTDLGKTAQALENIRQARALVGGGWRGAELEAQIRARTGDASGAVAALRSLESERPLDRSALRSDPAYVTIATDPAWISFLNEKRPTPAKKN